MSEQYEEHGARPQGESQVVSKKILKGTTFFRPGNELRSAQLYNSVGLSKHWQTILLPVQGKFMYDVTDFRVSHNLVLEVGANAQLNSLYLKTFEESTLITIDTAKLKEMYVFTLSDLLPYQWVPTTDGSGAINYQRQAKQNIWTPLGELFQFGTGLQVDVTVSIPQGFVAEAYAAGTTPLLFASGLPADGGTPANAGFYISLFMNSIEAAQS